MGIISPFLSQYSSNVSVIQVGTCSDGECTEKNLTTHEVSKNPRKQHYNPEDDLCMQLTTKVNQDFFPVSRCQVYCRGWGVRPLNDERLCVLRTKEIRSVFGKKKRVVTKTGVCRLGVCVEANMTPWRHPKGCKDRNVKHGGKILAENCTSFCDNGVKEEREEGTICVLEKKSSWIKDVTIKGICRRGMCIKTPPLDGTLVVWDPNVRCAVYQEQVTTTKFAAPMCSMYCSGRFKPMQDGTPCVLERSFDFWWKSKVKRLGVCRLGTCIEKAGGAKQLTRTERSRRPEFPLELWNVINATLQGKGRTNNACEGSMHPSTSLDIAIPVLDSNASSKTKQWPLKLLQVCRGEQPAKKTRKETSRLQNRLRNLCKDYLQHKHLSVRLETVADCIRF
ncbi:uncharacterized protein ISCGN_007622 [Ixodes scapularis]